ncbi:MAG: hypothetical protein RMJ88_10475 [Thermogemmata sp.]|nr:hypothetical protein [Thermogemmata sp.]
MNESTFISSATVSSPPRLPGSGDTQGYVPVSWMAVAAAAVSGLFVLILVFSTYTAFTTRRPLVLPELLVLPAIAIVLSFAARRLINNSEGTRTGLLYGIDLVNTSWWLAVIGGLGYAAYLFAIDYSIRRDGEAEIQRWLEHLTTAEGDPEVNFNRAFLRTLEPGRRTGLRPENTQQLRSEFRDPYTQFRQCDLVRLCSRNRGVCQVNITGVRNWSSRPWGVECEFSATLTCPEGVFPLSIPVKGMEPTTAAEAAAGRQWAVVIPANGYIIRDKVQYTDYGVLLAALEMSGGKFGRDFITASVQGPHIQHYLYHRTIAPLEQSELWEEQARASLSRMALVGGPAGPLPFFTRDSFAYYRDKFLTLPNEGIPSPEQKNLFRTIWYGSGLLPPGSRLRNSPDTQDILMVYADRVEVQVPCELPFPGAGAASLAAARGRLIVVSRDPALLEKLRQLREQARPGQLASNATLGQILQEDFRWRVVRLESDMYRIMPTRAMPGEPGAEVP